LRALCLSQTYQFDDLTHQRRLRKLGDLAREFAALTFKLLVPIRRLQTAQAIGQNDLRKQALHGHIETVVASAWHGLPAMIGFYRSRGWRRRMGS
jgi:hypothetical protein